jgi:hypothetical protein
MIVANEEETAAVRIRRKERMAKVAVVRRVDRTEDTVDFDH